MSRRPVKHQPLGQNFNHENVVIQQHLRRIRMNLNQSTIKLSDKGKISSFSLSKLKVEELSSVDTLGKYIVLEDGDSQYVFTLSRSVIEVNVELTEKSDFEEIFSKRAGTSKELSKGDCVLEFRDVEFWSNGAFSYDGRTYNRGIVFGNDTIISVGYRETEGGEDLFRQIAFNEYVPAREYKDIKAPSNAFDPRIQRLSV
jgi:hypothetical protein